MQNQANDLPAELQKTAIATAMEDLTFGGGSQSAQSELQQSPPVDEYSHLDKFTAVQDEQVGEVAESEEMTESDISALAGYGVSSLADFIESTIEAPVTIDNETREVIAEKAAPVVRKYCKGGMPSWMVKWKEEIELGLVLGTAAISVFKQIKAYEKENTKGELNSENTEVVSGH
ncbi:hypothetical protein JJQ94_16725 [Pseudoalteromonas sp. GCY]|uniref:hypothetical protein n=1 Tax=Pseudoalteromonas sp. GCY TaxID=2003316 RepID=UPI001145F3D9|nr:hypothetical protein [Pseudoalteromonas sp. GCY]QQQ65943.1 hypothetical protein JJQ94_16725 [Pseudoalteromonas sp. GCY]